MGGGIKSFFSFKNTLVGYSKKTIENYFISISYRCLENVRITNKYTENSYSKYENCIFILIINGKLTCLAKAS